MENDQANTKNTVEFTSIDPSTMKFSEEFRCARSTAGQVVLGLKFLESSVLSQEPSNNYQTELYPLIVKLADEVCEKYMQSFVHGTTDDVKLQVFGANLNGRFNDGRLKHNIVCKNTKIHDKYKYAQLGQLLSLLYDRLLFISRRDVTKILRYVANVEERIHFETLQNLCTEFCNYLRNDENSVMTRWTSFVNTMRQNNNIQPKQQTPERQNYSTSENRGNGRGTSRGNGRGTSRGNGRGTSRGRSNDSHATFKTTKQHD
jgi:hypothetical protein